MLHKLGIGIAPRLRRMLALLGLLALRDFYRQVVEAHAPTRTPAVTSPA